MRMNRLAQTSREAGPEPITMLELVFRLCAEDHSCEEIERRARHLIRSNQVRLVGTFCVRNQRGNPVVD